MDGDVVSAPSSSLVAAQDRHFEERASTWTRRYRTHPSFRARLAVVGEAVDRAVAEAPGARVLDYGGGMGIFSELAAQREASVVCVDRSLPMLRYGKTHRSEIVEILASAGFSRPPGAVLRVVGDERVLGRAAGTFDVVLAIAVLEYVDDCARVVGRLATLLRPGGVLLATVPEPRSPVRLAQRMVGPLAASGRVRSARVTDQSFAAIRPHGDRVLWRQAASDAELHVQGTVAIPLGDSGVRAFVHPSVLVRLQRAGLDHG